MRSDLLAAAASRISSDSSGFADLAMSLSSQASTNASAGADGFAARMLNAPCCSTTFVPASTS